MDDDDDGYRIGLRSADVTILVHLDTSPPPPHTLRHIPPSWSKSVLLITLKALLSIPGNLLAQIFLKTVIFIK